DARCEFAFVEIARTIFRDELEAAREILLHESVAFLRTLAAGQEQLREARPVGQVVLAEVMPEQLRTGDRETVLRIADGRIEQGGETLLAAPVGLRILVRAMPCIDRARR